MASPRRSVTPAIGATSDATTVILMRFRGGLRAAVIGSIGIMLGLGPAMGGTLKVGGTGAVTELLRQLVPAFEADSGIALQVIGGLGTSGANSAVAAGELGLAFSGRDLRDK